ncbi:MAG: serpin family protein [Proteobacteria bacterium]|nr:serpin family protein [Pseudomonadota bacterium]
MVFRKALFGLLSGLLAFSAVSCDGDNDDDNGVVQSEQFKSVKSAMSREKAVVDDAQLASFVESQYDLNLAILREPASKFEKNNAMISTFSIQPALAMTWAGANGTTADEMKSALRFGDNPHKMLNYLDALVISKNKEARVSEYNPADAVEIHTENNLYLAPAEKWSDTWLDTLAVNYGVGIWSTDFAEDPEAARLYINDAVSKSTHEKIQDLLPEGSLKPNTEAVITNAVYFKAPWRDHFDLMKTPVSFVKLDNSEVEVNYIRHSEKYGYAKDDNYTAVSVPLRDNDFEIMFIMPEAGKFDTVLASLSGKDINKIINNMKREATIDLMIPTYTFTTTVQLSAPFKALGMQAAFGAQADFSGMTGGPNGLYISEIYHKTFIGLDEKGVEAAAATAVVMDKNGVAFDVVSVTLDHPSIFVIYEKESHTPLFFGQLMDPSKQ